MLVAESKSMRNAVESPDVVEPPLVRRGFVLLIGLLLLIGVVVRGLPQLMGEERYLQHFPSEDGYLMLTIARNLALGLGMSTADGTIPTNGTQPATTFVWALGFLATGGDKVVGVLVALVLQFCAALVSTWLLFRVTSRLLVDHRYGRTIAWLAAGAWTASQRTTGHVMNCLETGFYALVLLLFADRLLVGGDPLRPWRTRRAAGLGLLLGLVFWVRIDAVFLIAIVCLVRWLFGAGLRFRPSLPQYVSAVVTGSIAVLVASPWLLYNKLAFGRFTPVSGISQSHTAGIGDNLTDALRALTEYALLVVPFPQAVIDAPWLIAVTVVVSLGGVVVGIVCFRASGPAVRTALLVFGAFGACLFAYYGLMFGAAHFVSRYLFPTSLLLAPLTAGAMVWLWSRLPRRTGGPLFALGSAMLLVVVTGTQWRMFHNGARHQHWQVVQFVRGVPDTTWVAAVQTGTLGYFHDRTINLDGKVNPDALAALLEGEAAWHRYIADGKAEYVIDWAGMARFVVDHPEAYKGKMEVLIEDHDQNLAVLERIPN